MLLKMKKIVSKNALEKEAAESSLPAEFFSLMDELNRDVKKRRAAAVKVMKKASTK